MLLTTAYKKRKNKKYISLFTILILLIILILIMIKKESYIFNTSSHILKNNDICRICQSKDIVFHIYNTMGQIQLKLKSHSTQYSLDQKVAWFIYPSITIFNEKNIPTWKITTNKAKLDSEKTLYLYENTYISNLIKNAYLKSIITNQATIDLITQDITSNEKVIIHGHCFHSAGAKMHANLYTQTAKLFGNTKTHYDI